CQEGPHAGAPVVCVRPGQDQLVGQSRKIVLLPYQSVLGEQPGQGQASRKATFPPVQSMLQSEPCFSGCFVHETRPTVWPSARAIKVSVHPRKNVRYSQWW